MEKKVLPTLFALDKQTFNSKLEKLKFLDELHIDFMDGKFTSKKSISLNDMKEILNYPNINFQIHLMAHNPEEYIAKLKQLNIKKAFIHLEVYLLTNKLEKAIETFKENKIKIGLVLNPQTEVKEIIYFLNQIDSIMLMSVIPGAEGQEFIKNIYSKITEIRKINPLIDIQIDGGINITNAQKIIQKGANILCIGSYISGNENPQETYEKIIEIIN